MDPPAVRPLMVLQLCGKNERVARNEKKPMVSNFMVLGQPVTSEVRLNTEIVNWDGDLADAIKPTKASESLSK